MSNRDYYNLHKLELRNDSLKYAFTPEMYIELEECFLLVSQGELKITANKLPLLLHSLGMSMQEVQHFTIQHDNEEIYFDKFLEIILECMQHPNWAANEMHESYNLFDRDGNGNIAPMDLRMVFTRLGENLLETELEDQLREFDIDGDLKVL
jgi:calmodulin